VGHFVLFGVLSWLTVQAVRQEHPACGKGRALVCCTLALMGAAALEELSQLYIPARTFSVLDLAASWCGIAAFGALSAAAAR
jgi:VanZ family protein